MAITRICSKTIQASDIQKLFAFYSDRDPPSVEYLRDPRFFDSLLHDVFGVNEPNMTDQKIWLLAYASCSSSDEESSGKLEKAMESLQFIRSVISRFNASTDMSDVFIGLLDAAKIPIACQALLIWIRKAISDPSFYESNAMTLSTELPILFELMDEIAIQNPLQREYISSILVENLDRAFDTVSPLQAIEIKKRYVDRMVFLVKLGYVMPIFNRIDNDEKLDETLSGYFLNEILAVTSPPYDSTIISKMLSLLPKVKVGLNTAISEFIAHVDTLGPTLQKPIWKIWKS
ncbi:TH1 protein [Chytridium lagenaria]|nr:TH1 protein [Chytridium lagenaria]